jgi:general secretion pathway protein H
MLVVMLLIALLISIVTLVPQGSGSQQARREAERFAVLLDLLRQQAVERNQVYGLQVDAQGYNVQWLDGEGHWQPSADFRRQNLPGGLRFRLDLTTNKPNPTALKTTGLQPDLLVLPSDETSPFTAWVENEGKPVLTITSDGLDEVNIESVQ